MIRHPWYARLSPSIRYGRRAGPIKEEIAESQERKCAICQEINHILHLDHDHVTGEIRESLCPRCNVGIAQFLDNPALLRRAADYLVMHDSIQTFRRQE